MSHEVDLLAVGEESKSGDAIAFRYGTFPRGGPQKIVVIDGGFQESGEKLVEHIVKCYRTNRVDIQILTHPDADHVNGARVVLEQMDVRQLWMHRPWAHADDIRDFLDHGLSNRGFNDKMKEALEGAWELEKLANRRGVPIIEPFTGTRSEDGQLVVLGPDESYYCELLAQFGEEELTSASLIDQVANVFSALGSAAVALAKKIYETWDKDALTEPAEDAVSPQNNSSVVLLAHLDDRYYFFTGDAGVPALTRVADLADMCGIDLPDLLTYFQAPHHGSKRNLGPAVLNRLVGPIVSQGTPTAKSSFISAAKNGEPKHPSRRVTNALIRRGRKVFTTQGTGFYTYSSDLGLRPGWSPATPVSFCTSYDEEED